MDDILKKEEHKKFLETFHKNEIEFLINSIEGYLKNIDKLNKLRTIFQEDLKLFKERLKILEGEENGKS